MSCARAMVYTASATSKQQGKATCLYSSYAQVVDNSVDKFISVDFVVDKFWEGVGKIQNHRAHFTQKIYMRSRACVRICKNTYILYSF